MSSSIQVRKASKVFQSGFWRKAESTIALDDVSFSIAGDVPSITAIAGESGSGKTTLARLMMGFIRPTSGGILYGGKDLWRMTRSERMQFRREVQPIFQDPYEAFNPFYHVDHVLQAPIRNFRLADSNRDGRKLIDKALETMGLRPSETLGRFPHQLSGGQRQRLMVARALLSKPRVIIADEPVSMVDASLRATILASLKSLNEELGISIIYITHDLTTAYQICQNIAVMYLGSVVEAGSVEQVIRHPKHPYTRLLISSIPLPDPARRWGDEALREAENRSLQTTGCRFAPRCPLVMAECWEARPPLYLPDENRTASCFVYRESPQLDDPDVARVFSPPAAHPPSHLVAN